MVRDLVRGLMVAGVLMMAAGAGLDEAAKGIKLPPAVKAGESFDMVRKVTHAEKVKGTISGNAVDFSLQTVALLEATVSVKAVDAEGRETEFHVVVKKLEYTPPGGEAGTVAPAGREYDVVYGGKTADITCKGRDLTDSEKKALHSLFPANSTSRASALESGASTSDEKNVGETWKLSAEDLAKQYPAVKADPKKIAGEAKLVDRNPLAGKPAVTVSVRVEATGLSSGALDKLNVGRMTVNLTEHVPVADGDVSLDYELKSTMHRQTESGRGSVKSATTEDQEDTIQETRRAVK